MNLKLLLLPVAVLVEIPYSITKGYALGFGDWCFDRKPGDPLGKTWQTRAEAIADQERNKHQPP